MYFNWVFVIIFVVWFLSSCNFEKEKLIHVKGEWQVTYQNTGKCKDAINKYQSGQLILVKVDKNNKTHVVINFDFLNEEEGVCYQYHTVGDFPLEVDLMLSKTELLTRLKRFSTETEVLEFSENKISIREGNNIFTIRREN